MRKRLTKSSVKEAIEYLPSGVCYFTEEGLPVLCNQVMQNFVYALTGHNMQIESDLLEII